MLILKMLINIRRNKQLVVYLCNGILLYCIETNYCQHRWISDILDCAKEVISFLLYEVIESARLTYSDRNQISSCFFFFFSALCVYCCLYDRFFFPLKFLNTGLFKQLLSSCDSSILSSHFFFIWRSPFSISFRVGLVPVLF